MIKNVKNSLAMNVFVSSCLHLCYTGWHSMVIGM